MISKYKHIYQTSEDQTIIGDNCVQFLGFNYKYISETNLAYINCSFEGLSLNITDLPPTINDTIQFFDITTLSGYENGLCVLENSVSQESLVPSGIGEPFTEFIYGGLCGVR